MCCTRGQRKWESFRPVFKGSCITMMVGKPLSPASKHFYLLQFFQKVPNDHSSKLLIPKKLHSMSGKWLIESTTLTGKSTSPRPSHITFYASYMYSFVIMTKLPQIQEVCLPNQPLRMHILAFQIPPKWVSYVVLKIVNSSRSYFIVHSGCPCIKSWLRTI